MIKSYERLKKQNKERIRVPRTVQDTIPVDSVYKDGIFRSGNRYTKSYRFLDINYKIASGEDKNNLFLTYSDLLNSFDPSVMTKITINNRKVDIKKFKEKVVAINRVAKVVKGGRNFRFSAVVVVGDENGHVGIGNGKAAEVPDAIKKAIEDAKKNLIEVPIVGTTVPHEYLGTFGSASVLIKPGAEGSGLIAGGSVRPILELAGYRDIKTKVIGTNNPRNVGYATMNALENMATAESIAKKRGKKVEEI